MGKDDVGRLLNKLGIPAIGVLLGFCSFVANLLFSDIRQIQREHTATIRTLELMAERFSAGAKDRTERIQYLEQQMARCRCN